MEWTGECVLLGITLTVKKGNNSKILTENKQQKINKVLRQWKRRRLTLIERLTVIKALLSLVSRISVLYLAGLPLHKKYLFK